MKVAITFDEYGHFHAVDITHREQFWLLITEDCPDIWDNMHEDWPEDLDYMSLSEEKWHEFVMTFNCRERIEIREVR